MIKCKVLPLIVAALLVVSMGACCKDDNTLGLLSSGGAGGCAGCVPLGSAGNFAILAGTAITNTGNTNVSGGDIGLNGAASSVTGFPPGVFSGAIRTIPPDDAIIIQARIDLLGAFNNAASRTAGVVTVAGDIGGQTLAPGLYKSTSSLGITGTLTLDAGGDASKVFVFQIASALTTLSGSQVVLTGGALPEHVFWQVGSSTTLGTNSVFEGIILCQTAITLQTGATLDGRALTYDAEVTLDTNPVTVP